MTDLWYIKRNDFLCFETLNCRAIVLKVLDVLQGPLYSQCHLRGILRSRGVIFGGRLEVAVSERWDHSEFPTVELVSNHPPPKIWGKNIEFRKPLEFDPKYLMLKFGEQEGGGTAALL